MLEILAIDVNNDTKILTISLLTSGGIQKRQITFEALQWLIFKE